MTAFWAALAALACAATAAVIWPLLRTPRGGPTAAPPAGESTLAADEAKRLAVYRDRRHEIDTEAQAGRLSPEEAQRAQAELVAEVADHFPVNDAAPVAAVGRPASAGKPWLLVAGLALAIPLLAALVYDRVGAPGVVALAPFELRGEMDPARLDAAITDLRERATRAATDGEAWAMLAEALRLKGDLAGSAEAFAKAAQYFSPPSARLLADYADVLVSLKGGEFGPEPVALLTRALAINPRDPKSLALMGAAQYRNGDLKSALTTLRTLRDLLPPDSGQAGAIGEAIGRIETTLGVAAAPGGAPSAGNPAGAAGGPTTPAASTA
ncbi:MAG: c-type cytochrome biogenesis protein CcmI, partial [Burkholderiales bacterium]|nr:c-type cytochrome biogenesis protein CcmI [Burkholderiales bacterium]